MKIVTKLGASPQWIKSSSLNRNIITQSSLGQDIRKIIIPTGHHYDASMREIFFKEMKIPKPGYFLGIINKRQDSITGQMIKEDIQNSVIVYKYTNLTLAAAITSAKLHIKIAHTGTA